jgi:hypothetical protein
MPNRAEQAMGEIVAAYDAGELKRKPEESLRWSQEAVALLRTVEDLAVRGNLSMRAEKKARQEKSAIVEAIHLQVFLNTEGNSEESVIPAKAGIQSVDSTGLPPLRERQDCGSLKPPRSPDAQSSAFSPAEIHWQAAALARLMRVPEGFMRDKCKQRIEDYARQNGHAEITLDVAEEGLKQARSEMEKNMQGQGESDSKPKQGGCPFGHGKKR